MRKPLGYSVIVEPDKPTIERDNTVCGHCQRIIFIKPNTGATVYLVVDRRTLGWTEVAGAFCRVCMRPVCLACHATGGCTPWERMLDASEARERLRRAVAAG